MILRFNECRETAFFSIAESQYFDKYMTMFFDAFNITRNNFSYSTWIGRTGRVRVKNQKTDAGRDFCSVTDVIPPEHVPAAQSLPQQASGVSRQASGDDLMNVPF